MRITPDGTLHLTYCTNIHAADGWPAVRAALERFAPALKARFSPHAPFGVGLRLSARDARELLDGHLDELRSFLDDAGLYVAILNGFPHGSFHRSVVKAGVYAPDWRDPARVAYTLDLIEILAALLPEGVDGGISTVPLSYKPWMRDAAEAEWDAMTAHVAHIAVVLARLKRERGTSIHLDLEPEPDCVIENTAETIDYFERRLLPRGARHLSAAIGLSEAEAGLALLDHVRLCFDCCHFSVEHEDHRAALVRIQGAGIRIGRIQLSSALRVEMPGSGPAQRGVLDRLRPFADSTYLHQVIRRGAGGLAHYPDLGAALDEGDAGEWRIHFHVPLFTNEYEGLQSTQADVRTVLAAVSTAPITSHLEIETYTWDVLPGSLKIDLLESIAREYAWVLANLPASKGPAAL